jgi:hypothetical protein
MGAIPTVPILPGAAHFDPPNCVAAWPPEPDGIHFGKRFVLMKRSKYAPLQHAIHRPCEA